MSLAWFLKETPDRAAYAAAVNAAEDLDSFDIRVHLDFFTARRVVELARGYHLQGYDAVYFDLARNLKVPLATLDHGHRQATRTHNLMVFSPAAAPE